VIYELARKYDLVIYDPQGPAVYIRADEDVAPYSPGLGEFVRCALLTAVGVLIGVLGWKLSVPVITCVLVFVGGFVTLVAVVSTAAIAHEAWRVRATRAQ
jgi:hypothetical protein